MRIRRTIGYGGPRKALPDFTPVERDIRTVHQGIPGRVRLHVDGLRGNEGLKSALENACLNDGIRRITASSITGNILIFFDPEHKVAAVIDEVQLIIRSPAPERPSAPPPEPRPGLWALFRSLFDRPGSAAPDLFAAPPHRTASGGPVAEQLPQSWHALPAAEAAALWGTALDSGLSAEAARQRLIQYGPNVLPPVQQRSPLAMFMGQFNSLPVFLLLGSAALSVATGGVTDALVIGAVVILNAAVGFTTEYQAERTIHSLLEISEPDAVVVRDGAPARILASEVVPGDLLLLTRGDQVPADARLLSCSELYADEAALTGESVPVEKSATAVLPPPLPLAERINMVFRGTIVTGGSARAVVISTGRHTQMGVVQALLSQAIQPQTPLQEQMERLGTQLSWAVLCVAGAVFGVGLLRGIPPLEMLRGAVSLGVAAVPEGLPVVATVCLANGIRRLIQHKVLVRRLEAIEALGSVQVVCFDKTGTLTLNRMSVVSVLAGNHSYDVVGGKLCSGERRVALESHAELAKLVEVCCLCNDAEVVLENGDLTVCGSPTEAALLRMGLGMEIDITGLRRRSPVLNTVRRSESRAFMATWHGLPGGRTLVAVKGSPAQVLEMCGWHAQDSKVRPLGDSDRNDILAANHRMARKGLRVLGVACAEAAAGQSGACEPESPSGLVWLGLAGIADPPRGGLREVLGELRRAGIEPLVLTGDQAATAQAIAEELELNGGTGVAAVNAPELEGLPPEDVAALARRARVLSRVTPSHKLQVVRALQQSGAVVAMTGDGINDAPALKAADIGIALGDSGTRVARGVADVLLMDDSIEALLPAIREGRVVYADLRKAIHFMAATNSSEILVTFAALAAGIGQPFNARQLLWINLLSDVFPELALALERPESDLLRKPPRAPGEAVITRADYPRLGLQAGILSASGMGAYLYGLARYGPGVQAGSMAFLSLMAAQLLHGITARSETRGLFSGADSAPANPLMWGGLLAGFGLLALSQLVPGITALLGATRIGLGDALVCAGSALASFVANEALKRPLALLPAPASPKLFENKELDYGALQS